MDGFQTTERGFTCVAVLIAGLAPLLRHGLNGVLMQHQPTWRIAEADSFDLMLEYLRLEKPDLLLLDAQLPAMNGTDGVRRLRPLIPKTKILVLADRDDRATVLGFIDAGASGYVTNSADAFQVVCAFNTVLAGGIFVPASLTQAIAPVPALFDDMPPAYALAALTDRQREVFRLMAQGYATKTIARQLGLAVGTVKVHLAAIYRILGAHSRTEAVAKIGRLAPGAMASHQALM